MCIRVYASANSERTMWFVKRRLTNTPRCHRLADGQLSFNAPPSFSSFGAASANMCCSARPDYSSARLRPSFLPEDRIGREYTFVDFVTI